MGNEIIKGKNGTDKVRDSETKKFKGAIAQGGKVIPATQDMVSFIKTDIKKRSKLVKKAKTEEVELAASEQIVRLFNNYLEVIHQEAKETLTTIDSFVDGKYHASFILRNEVGIGEYNKNVSVQNFLHVNGDVPRVFHQEGHLDEEGIAMLKKQVSFNTTGGTYFLTSLSLYPAEVEVESQWNKSAQGKITQERLRQTVYEKERERQGRDIKETSETALNIIASPRGVEAIEDLKRVLSEVESQGYDPKNSHGEQIDSIQRYLDSIESTQLDIRDRALSLFRVSNQLGNPNAKALIATEGARIEFLDNQLRNSILNQVKPGSKEVFSEIYSYIAKELGSKAIISRREEESSQDYRNIGVTKRIWAEDV